MAGFIPDFFEKKLIDGLNYYIVPNDASLYRGDNNIFRDGGIETHKIPDKIYFFGANAEDVDQYGIVYEFTPDREYKLLALDDDTTMNVLYLNSSPEIQTILTENYGYNSSTSKSTKKRDSVLAKDMKLSIYLCNKGYDGYATNDMQTDTGDFHKEIMICHPQNLLITRMVTPENKIPGKLADSQARKDKRDRAEEKNKKRRPMSSPTSSPTTSPPTRSKSAGLFGTDESPQGNGLFGSPAKKSKGLFASPTKKSKGLFGSPTKKSKRRGGSRKKKTIGASRISAGRSRRS